MTVYGTSSTKLKLTPRDPSLVRHPLLVFPQIMSKASRIPEQPRNHPSKQSRTDLPEQALTYVKGPIHLRNLQPEVL